jgi:hypothetical protein
MDSILAFFYLGGIVGMIKSAIDYFNETDEKITFWEWVIIAICCIFWPIVVLFYSENDN